MQRGKNPNENGSINIRVGNPADSRFALMFNSFDHSLIVFLLNNFTFSDSVFRYVCKYNGDRYGGICSSFLFKCTSSNVPHVYGMGNGNVR